MRPIEILRPMHQASAGDTVHSIDLPGGPSHSSPAAGIQQCLRSDTADRRSGLSGQSGHSMDNTMQPGLLLHCVAVVQQRSSAVTGHPERTAATCAPATLHRPQHEPGPMIVIRRRQFLSTQMRKTSLYQPDRCDQFREDFSWFRSATGDGVSSDDDAGLPGPDNASQFTTARSPL